MARFFEYAVLRLIPDARRGECVNIGVVVFRPESIDVRMLPSFAKVTAISGAVDVGQLRELPSLMAEWIRGVAGTEAQHAALRDVGVVTVSELGTFEVKSAQEYETRVAELMRTLVTPPPAARLPVSSTKVTVALKAKFKAQKILGSETADLKKHLVVPNFPISEHEGLFSDFVVKNGAYHVTETADLRAATANNMDRVRVASLAAIKLIKAKEKFGPRTRRFVVYASRKGVATQAINLIGDYSDAIFHLESRQDMSSYMDKIMQAASPTHDLSERN